MSQDDVKRLAVIAVYFNPVGYQTRHDLLKKFEQHMSTSGVFLFTVECIFQSAPMFGLAQQQFQVTQTNNQQHLQLVAPSILWMKENLINIAVKHLPKYIEYVAWIDTDIEFERLDWPILVIEELQKYPIVQLFESARFLGPNGKNEVLRHNYSFAYSIRHDKPIDPRRYNEWYPHPGYAWGMRRIAFEMINGLCEIAIVGSGDLHFAFALLDRVNETLSNQLNEDYREQVKSWAARVAQLSQKGQNVGYVPVHIYHHWHGNRDDRGYVERWRILEKYQFAPSTDLKKNPQTGIIGLANKRQTDKVQMSTRLINFEKDIVTYFRSRKEDDRPSAPRPQAPVKPTHHSTASRPTMTSYHPYPSTSHNYHQSTYWVDCTCPYDYHHHQNHHWGHHDNCPCCIHYYDHSDSSNEIRPDEDQGGNGDEDQDGNGDEDQDGNGDEDQGGNGDEDHPGDDQDGDGNNDGEGPGDDVEPGSFY